MYAGKPGFSCKHYPFWALGWAYRVGQELEGGKPGASTRRSLLAKLLMARAHQLSGAADGAQKNLVEVLEFAAEEGQQRLILGEDYLVAPLLADMQGKLRRHSATAAQFLEKLTAQQTNGEIPSGEAADLGSKLGAHSRTQAIALARSRRLI